MNRFLSRLLLAVATTGLVMAQIPTVSNQTTDILGAHLGYGRGCVMCHAPHSGAAGNGGSVAKDSTSGNLALWGQDLTPLYGQTLGFGDYGSYKVTLPAQGAITSPFDANTGILLCLSCHDGNLAKPGMMKGKTVETLPIVGGNAPTFLGNDGTTAGNYANDHPVGAQAIVQCGGTYDWDCSGGNTTAITMNGPASSVFANTNYGFAVSFGKFGSVVTAVTCMSCHDQHSQNVYSGTMGGVKGNYQTMFFLRGYYNPATGGNNAAQFCRQCHGGESNEMHGQLNVPTT
ncbi:MAG: hypothetical protein U0Q18_03805 [Bryobacteraceae bacterium]